MNVKQTLREAAWEGISRYVIRSEQEFASISRAKSSLRKMTKQYPNFYKRQYGFYSNGKNPFEIFFETVGTQGVPKSEACILYVDSEEEAEEIGDAVISFTKDVLKGRMRLVSSIPDKPEIPAETEKQASLEAEKAPDVMRNPNSSASSDGEDPQYTAKRKKVYISGPITNHEGFLEAFAEAEEELKKRGYSPVNPAKVNHELPDDMEYGEYMRMSLTMMSFCDLVYMMDGWEKSRGAKFEKNYAEMCGKRILYQKKKT